MTATIFLSHFLDDSTPGYGGVKAFEKKAVNEICKGCSSNSEQWILSNHVGTHIDLPAHFDDAGKRLEEFDPKDWIMNKPYLIHLSASENQIIEHSSGFDSIPVDCDLLLLKTEFQKKRTDSTYWQNGPGLSPDLAKWIRKNRPNIKILGFDFISITSYSNRPLGRIAHREFLGHEGANQALRVIEDMKLDELKTSPKKVIVAPVLVKGADGAPVTVIAEI